MSTLELQRYDELILRVLKEKVKSDPHLAFVKNRLCPRCRSACMHTGVAFYPSIPENGRLLNIDFPFHATLEEWALSVADGCNLCAHLWHRLHSMSDSASNYWEIIQVEENILGLIPIEDLTSGAVVFQDLVLRVTSCKEVTEDKPHFAVLVALRGSATQYLCSMRLSGLSRNITNILERRELSLFTGSNFSFDTVKSWINRCIDSHTYCREASDRPHALPTRLLDVGETGCGEILKLRSVKEIQNCSARVRPRYICLSHRWPKEPILSLTTSTMDLFMQGLDNNELPITFQDAAIITRRLGFRFLWIDSLCIIQDCTSDWERESAIMGDIYQGSVCSIAALNTTTPRKGCFAIRNPFDVIPCTERWLLSTLDEKAKPLHSRQLLESELLSRGWVMQERTLSPRTIYYGSDEILWECITCIACEEWPNFNTLNWGTSRTNPKHAYSRLCLDVARNVVPDLRHPSLALLHFHSAWTRILEDYAGCKLTRAEDKLVAINGIVRKIEDSSGMAYVAGLWRDILPAELLWYVPTPDDQVAQTSTPVYRAPSWSWAALDVPIRSAYVDLVRNGGYTFEWPLRTVAIHADCKPNGQVNDAHIVLDVSLRSVPLGAGLNYRTALRDRRDVMKELRGKDQRYFIWDSKNSYEKQVFALLVARGTNSALTTARDVDCKIWEDRRCDVGIMLVKEERHDSYYRRVGYFEEHYWSLDTWPLFAHDKSTEKQQITLI